MNSPENSIKQSALGWVKKSIDDNLSDIKTDLKLYIEEADDALLAVVKEKLGVIQGVLVMIEQYGAAMLTDEMVSLTDFIIDNKQEKSEQALEVMLRAVLQLPDYLEHIQSGHRDIPIAILPLLNDIRAVRDQDLFSEKLLFLPDLSMHQEDAKVASIDDKDNQVSRLLAKKLRPVYQLALVNVIKDQSVEENLKRLEKICETLEERAFSEQIARIWWIVGALIESVSRQQLELGVSIKNLLGKVDALFRVILIIGERGLLQRQPIELIKNFLFYIAQPECDGPKAKSIKTAYRLEQFLPSESARSEVLDNIAGPNQALLKTVSEAVKADIEAIKSTLEVYVNGDLTRVEALKDLPQEMHIISDTLAMIGLGSQRQLIKGQISIVKDIVSGDQVADEERLLSMAAELLQIEQALDQMQKRQPIDTEQSSSETDVSRDYELDSVLTAVVTAALDDIQKTKNAILDFIKDPGRSENIDLCIALMDESRGALQLMNQHRAVAVVDGLLAYLRGYDIVEFMEASRLDALSQVVVSLEYYLEALGEHRSDAGSILDFADVQLQELLSNVHIGTEDDKGDEPLVVVVEAPAEVAPEELPLAAVTDDLELEIVQSDAGSDIPVESVVPAESDSGTNEPGIETETASIDQDSGGALKQVPTALDDGSELSTSAADEAIAAEVETANAPVDARIEVEPVEEDLQVLRTDSDPEILEIYLEEAEEEAQNIARLQQDWLLHPEDENAVKNIRRAFHTIKGSGRLVGAMKIGEFAWDYEQLLNRIIDKTVAPNKQAIEAVGNATEALKELVNELKTAETPTADIGYLRGLARALAEFRADQLLVEHTQKEPAIESPYDRITDDESQRKGSHPDTTTQVIPPDRLNEMILDEIEPDTVQVDPDSFEVNSERIREQGGDAEITTDTSGLGDTQLVASNSIPARVEAGSTRVESGAPESEGEFREATDYSKRAVDRTRNEADEIRAMDIDDVEPAPREAIWVETMGEDFLGEFLGDDFAEETAEDVALTEETPAASEIENDEADLESSEAEAIEPEASEVEAAEPESSEAEAAELELLEVEAVEPESFEAEAVTMESIEPEEIVEQASETEIENSETLESGQGTEQESPPDPFDEMTGSLMPGEEAGDSEPGDQELPEPTDLSFDPELLIIYQQEVEQHLGIVSFALDHAEQIHELIPGEEIYRALHTIHGASRTADIRTIGELAGLMEKPLKSAIAQKLALDDEIVALYRQGQLELMRMTKELVASQQMPPIPEDLEISFRALAEDFEEYTVEIPEDEAETSGDFIDTLTMMSETADKEQDTELLTIFIDEANELLEMSDNTLYQWSQQKSDEAGAQDYNAVMELQRYLHTLKGGSYG